MKKPMEEVLRMRKNKNFIMFMYAMGYLGISIFTQTTVKWYQYFYTPPEGNKTGLQILVPVGMIGLIFLNKYSISY